MPQKKATAKGNIRWVGRFRPPGGRETSRSFDTRREAKAWEEEQARNYRRGVWLDPNLDKLTTYEVYERWSERPAREASKKVYAQVLKNLGPMGDIYARKLTRADVDAWFHVLHTARPWANNTALSPRTARDMVAHLSAAMSMAVDEEWVGRNPIKIPRIDQDNLVRARDIPTIEQIHEVVKQLRSGGAMYDRKESGKIITKKQQPAPTVADMVLVGVGTGARISELCGLNVSDVHLLRREIEIRHQAHAVTGERVPLKTRSSIRVVPIGNDLIPVLDRLIGGRPAEAPLFETRQGLSYRAGTAGQHFQRAANHLGYGWRFHSLRHFYASRLIAGGLPVNQVQHLLGHSDPAMTLRVYTHLWPDSEEVTRRAIEGILGGYGIIAGSEVEEPALRSV